MLCERNRFFAFPLSWGRTDSLRYCSSPVFELVSARLHWSLAFSHSNPPLQNTKKTPKGVPVGFAGRTDSPGCGRATAVASVHRTLSKSRLSNPSATTKKLTPEGDSFFVVGEDGFEPSKRNAADLQSVPFGHSGTPPDMSFVVCISRTFALYHEKEKCQVFFEKNTCG